MLDRLKAFGRGIATTWRRMPATIRKPLAAVMGLTLVLAGVVAVVLPGPFSIPPILLGLALLGTEFYWAKRLQERLTEKAKAAAATVRRRGRKR